MTNLFTNPSSAVVATSVLVNVVRLFSSIILTRILSPSDYGVVGIIMSLAVILVMLSDFGFFSFVVRHPDANDAQFLDEVWTIRLIRSAVLTVVMMALAYPYALFAGKLVLAPAIAAWAFTQLLEGLSSMAFAQSVRQGLVARLSWMELLINVIQVVITVLLALWLRNYWAIVFAALLGGLIKLLLSYVMFPDSRRRWQLSLARQREIWAFARFIAGSSILTLLINQFDKVVLSRVLSLDMFGVYSIATLLAFAPAAIVYPFCTRVLYPAYSTKFRESGIEGVSQIYYDRRRIVSYLFMFATGGLIGSAYLVIDILYEDTYAGVAPLLQILALAPLLLFNNVAGEQAMIAIGKPVTSFHINAARVTWLSCVGLAGYFIIGPIGVIWAVGTIEIAALLIVWWKLHRDGIFRLRQELMSLGVALAGVGVGLAISRLATMTGWF